MAQHCILATPATQGQRIASSISARGLELVSTTPSAVSAFGVYDKLQPAFANYIAYLPAYLAAATQGRNVSVHQEGYNIDYKEPLLPITEVPMALHFIIDGGSSKASEIQSWLSEKSYNRINMRGKEVLYIVQGVDEKVLRNLKVSGIKVNPDTHPTTSGVMNPRSYVAYLSVLRTISLFLRVHHYPAFYMDSDDYDEGESVRTLENTSTRDIFHEEEKKKRKRRGEDEAGPSQKIAKTAGVGSVQDEEMAIDEDPKQLPRSFQGSEAIFVARPVDLEDKVGWGDMTELPNCSGLFVPYISELLQDDPSYISMFMRRFFTKALGADPVSQAETLNLIRQQWGIVATTEGGRILSHIAKCIELGLETQSRPFPVFDADEYIGTVLHGYKFAIMLNGRFLRPTSFADLKESMYSSGVHSFVLQRMVDMINEAGKKIGGWEDIIATDVTSLRTLHRGFIKVEKELSENAAKELKEKADALRFREAPWPITHPKLLDFLNIVVGSMAEDESYPMGSRAFGSKDRIKCLLAVFGNMAPSPVLPGVDNHVISLSEPSTFRDDPSSPNILGFALLPLDAAARDWGGALGKGQIRNDARGRASSSKYRPFEKDRRTSLMLKMREASEAYVKSLPVEVRAGIGAKGGEKIVETGPRAIANELF